MQIIVRGKGSEPQRRKSETARSILKHYYSREQRDGARARFPVKKEVIRKLYEVR